LLLKLYLFSDQIQAKSKIGSGFWSQQKYNKITNYDFLEPWVAADLENPANLQTMFV
jgi:hypothetical protein